MATSPDCPRPTFRARTHLASVCNSGPRSLSANKGGFAAELKHAHEMAAHESPRTIKRSSSMTAPKSASQEMRWKESGSECGATIKVRSPSRSPRYTLSPGAFPMRLEIVELRQSGHHENGESSLLQRR
jgi:hypothetical protein